MASRKRSISNDEADMSATMYKEWDEALCPICMDHPHNAVLLICSAHGKGCRSYICDTSYRHSNCLDRFKKLKDENQDTDGLSAPNLMPGTHHGSTDSPTSIDIVGHDDVEGSTSIVNVNPNIGNQERMIWETLGLDERDIEKTEEGSDLRCPLCRGSVFGWKVMDDSRKYLNLKSRSCSHETCSFTGNYRELRGHARRVHPTVRPADVDPTRQRDWRRFEDQREYNDIVSAVRSAMPGAIILGDYAMESGDRTIGGNDRGEVENGRFLNALLLFQMFDSMDRRAGQRGGGRPRVLPRHRRASRTFPRHRYLWGENLLGLQDVMAEERERERDGVDGNVRNDADDDVAPSARRRRRVTRDRSDEDRQ